MQVKIYGEIYDCDKAVKGNDFVKLIKNEKSIAEFSGISDFNGYQIIEGEWSEPELTPIEQLQKENKELREVLRTTTNDTAKLIFAIMDKQGGKNIA